MDNQLLLAIGITLAIIVALVAVERYRTQRRRRQMIAVADRLGYEFAEEEAGLADALGEFPLCSRGGLSRKMTNLLRARVDGTAVTIFDYRYIVGHGRRKHTYRQSVLLFESQRLDLPTFALRPEGLGQKLAGALGQQDIDFEDRPDFSAAYVLQGPDEAQIRALFASEKLAFFAQRRGLCVEGQGQRLLYYRARKRVSPDAIPSFVEDGLAVFRLLAAEPALQPVGEPDTLAGLDALLDEMGVDEGTAAGTGPRDRH